MYDLPAIERERLSRHLAARIWEVLISVPSDGGDLDKIASRFGCLLHWDEVLSGHGMYLPPLPGISAGEILLRPGLSPGCRWRAFIRALSHHLMRIWAAHHVFGAECIVLVVDPGDDSFDPASVEARVCGWREDIADRVEKELDYFWRDDYASDPDWPGSI